MKILIIIGTVILLASSNLFGQISFDYSAIELVLGQFTEGEDNTVAIINNTGYQHILAHSKKYSSVPLTENNLRNSLNGINEGFDFSHVVERKEKYIGIIKFLKANEQEIINDYSKLCLKYLPDDYVQKATIYYVIGGYNGIAFDSKICMNIDFEQFRNNYKEIELYIAHELFHIGFEKYQPLPDIFSAKTVKDLKSIVLSMTMNEGLATLTPYHKRIELNEVSDNDYMILLDSLMLQKKVEQFNSVIKFMDENIDKELSNEILGNVLGQCSGDRLFYIVGCYIGLIIEEKYGLDKIKELIKQGHENYFEAYYQIIAEE
jgi:hypothetical protein